MREQAIDLFHKAVYAFTTDAAKGLLVKSGRHEDAESRRGAPGERTRRLYAHDTDGY
jgi:hypothetical protein